MVLALAIASSALAQEPVDVMRPLVLFDDQGAVVFDTDWSATNFRAVLFMDCAMLDRGLEGRLTRKLEVELELVIVAFVGADHPVRVVAPKGGVTRVEIHRSANESAHQLWLKQEQAWIWVVGPGGTLLGEYSQWDIDEVTLRVRLCRAAWPSGSREAIWRDLVLSENSWRYATGTLMRSPSYTDAASFIEEHGTFTVQYSPGDPEFDAAQVRLTCMLLLALKDPRELPNSFLDAVRGKLRKKRPHLKIALALYESATGGITREELIATLLPRKKGELLPHLIALRQLRIRNADIAHATLELLPSFKAKDWEVRSVALRLVADQASYGIGTTYWTRLAPDARPRLSKMYKEKSWQVRLAYAEALGTFSEKSCVSELIELLDHEFHPRVAEGEFLALQRLTGMKLGIRADKWKTWFADQPEDWKPIPTGPTGWRPPAAIPLANGKVAAPAELTVAAGGSVFETDLSNVVFVIDISRSMRDGLAREVRRNLELQFERLSTETSLGLVTFSERAQLVGNEMNPKLITATKRGKKGILSNYASKTMSGGTNMADGIRLAFSYPELEELFILTDGVPTRGDHVTTASLVELMDELNAVQRVRVNTVMAIVIGSYYIEDLSDPGALPEPTPEERLLWGKDWATMIAGMAQGRKFWTMETQMADSTGLLSELSRYNEGTLQGAFANQIYSRNPSAPAGEE